ncbi:MAG TPA: type II toxin-antitoxin system VapC family toxin [Candidatus Eisenbacteria bacterium]|nr:type II toxin-antitoxin system VapC family toxin [Candidatus Eisenbacteria bacterium]
MSRIFWDTNLFLYLFKGSAQYGRRVAEFREAMLRRGDLPVTSTLTLGEVLVKPVKEGDTRLQREYSAAIPAAAVLLPFDEKAAQVYAQLRSDKSVRAPDAIQLACAGSFGVDLFVTNDSRLHALPVQGIQFITSLERLPI